jgi:tetratricopeptide (TPR) repeat protein
MLERLARKHFERGRQFELQDREQEAMEEYRRACDLKPTSADPFLALGRLRALGGQLREAVALLDAAVERSSEPQIRQWRGYVYGRLRQYREALTDYKAADEGDEPNIKINIARMYLALGQFDEAHSALDGVDDPSAIQLRNALPRYEEFVDEPSDDDRALRYLFGGSLVLGTADDGGVRLRGDRYLLLTPHHIATTLQRFCRFKEKYRWHFDAVAGEGAHHAPIALAISKILKLPIVTVPDPEQRVLLCSAVLKGPVEAVRVSRPWRRANVQLMHLCIGLEPTGDPDEKEPELIGCVHRCSVPWYRVEAYARLEPDPEPEALSDSPWPGFRIGPAFMDANSERVAQGIVEAFEKTADDPISELLLGWYDRHRNVRAFNWT